MPDDGAQRRIIINGQSFAATGTRNHLHREKDLPAALLAEAKHDPRAVGTIEQILKRRTGRYGNLLVSYRAEKKSLTFRHFKKSPLFDSQQLLKPPAIKADHHLVPDENCGRAARTSFFKRFERLGVFIHEVFREGNTMMREKLSHGLARGSGRGRVNDYFFYVFTQFFLLSSAKLKRQSRDENIL